MQTKVLFVLLLACTAAVSADQKVPLQKRADGVISNLLDFTGSLTKNIVDKAVSGGHTSINAISGIINYSLDSAKSLTNTLLRRDLGMTMTMPRYNMPNPNSYSAYDTLGAMLAKAQTDLNNSWDAANTLTRDMRPNLSDRGLAILNMYMRELRTSRASYNNALSNAADLYASLSANPDLNDQDLVNLLQDQYGLEMIDYAQQARRLGNVIKNNGFDL
ncbi:unnamed protein product [Bemisia tabaci]|uniref:Uncharacterized protein n=1 Tax=Bemisia tabaci TaxID=7038 RepID=A0A9P0F2X0_BEMTA|nr:PREDICTED: uncharacterized protein LOC109031163 [Bemisia tabaci]CAH0386671.1 unnamed protein product [Bemisia tabaci]